jgi:hypothetical protein
MLTPAIFTWPPGNSSRGNWQNWYFLTWNCNIHVATGQFCKWHLANSGTSCRGKINADNIHVAPGNYTRGPWPTLVPLFAAIVQRWQYSRGFWPTVVLLFVATGQRLQYSRGFWPTVVPLFVPIGQRWQYSRGHRAIFHMALGQHWYFFMWHYVKTWHLANSGTSRPLLVAIGQRWQYSRGNRQFCTWHLTNTGTS